MAMPVKPTIEVDPFFEPIRDGTWNACVGMQGDEENYADGFIEAAMELVGLVIDNKMMGSLDTMALPVLYNARHSIELTLKFAIDRLFECGKLQKRHTFSHDIRVHWQLLVDARIGDESIRTLLEQLGRFVRSLDRIDRDGQELRYPNRKDYTASLSNNPTVNLLHVRKHLDQLNPILKTLKTRVVDLGSEISTGSCTSKCSRGDLVEIASMLGHHETWDDDGFERKKEAVAVRFGLDDTGLAEACKTIGTSRGLAVLVGLETSLTYLSDEKAVFAFEAWHKGHPQLPAEPAASALGFASSTFESIQAHQRAAQELDEAIASNLSLEELADLEVLFYTGLLRDYGELYDRKLETTVAKHKLSDCRWAGIHHVMSKTNLLSCVVKGARIVGRPSLAEKLQALRPSSAAATT